LLEEKAVERLRKPADGTKRGGNLASCGLRQLIALTGPGTPREAPTLETARVASKESSEGDRKPEGGFPRFYGVRGDGRRENTAGPEEGCSGSA